MNNDIIKDNLNIDKNIFKYGPPVEIKSLQPTTRNALYQSDVANSVQDLIDNSITVKITNSVQNYINTNITNIINNTDIVNEITNVVNNNIDIPPDLLINTLDLYSSERERISILADTHLEDNVIIANNGQFSDLTSYSTYGLITDKVIYVDNKIVLQDKELEVRGDELYFNGRRLKNIDNDEIYNNITPFSIDDNENAYTFSKIGINTSYPDNYNLTVDGTTNITGDLTLNSDLYLNQDKIHVVDNELYFNNQLVSCCEYEGIDFYLCYEYASIDINELDTAIKAVLTSNSIDYTYMKFTYNNIIGVNIKLRDDICMNSNYQESTITEIEKVKTLVNDGLLTVTVNSITRTAVSNIYFLNKYYYFNDLSKENAFKLVKRYDESNTTALRDDMQVFLVNINGKYLQKDFTFTDSGSNNLLLKVHAFTNNFLTENKNCFINLTDSFKLEYLVGRMIDVDCSTIIGSVCTSELILGEAPIPTDCSTIIGSVCTSELILGEAPIPTDFVQDTTWTNIGIDPSILTEDIFLATNINDYVTDPALYNDVYLIDQRWLTIVETGGVVIYGQTYDNNHSNSKNL
jgi:hypothetical protein